MNGKDYTSKVSVSQALIDSGTTCLVLPTEIYNVVWDEYLANVCNEQDETCQCTANSTDAQYYPNITFHMRGAIVTVPYMNYLLPFFNRKGEPTGTCGVCIQDSDIGFMIFGDPMMHSYIPIFDKANQQIGFFGYHIIQIVAKSIQPGCPSILDCLFSWLSIYCR
jgi:hypothetical protein